MVIAEDEALIRLDLAEMLAEEGYEVVGQASDGRQAIDLAEELRPDLVITDVIMPRLNGYELCERLKSDETTRSIPVVMVTVRAGDRDQRQGSSAGADAYLIKPFHLTELKATIDQLLPPGERPSPTAG